MQSQMAQQAAGWSDIAMLLATLLSGVLGAVFALIGQALYNRYKSIREHRERIFKTLMMTRAAVGAPTHIDALNSIDIEFFPPKGKNKKVVDAWRIYSEHLNHPRLEGEALNRWNERRVELLTDLLFEMAKHLGFDFDRVMLQRNAYYPAGYGENEWEQIQLRKAALAVFKGESSLKVDVNGEQ